jgi:hypothetical protein
VGVVEEVGAAQDLGRVEDPGGEGEVELVAC